MLIFAMDCFLAGLAVCLILGATQRFLLNPDKDHEDFLWSGGAFGLAIFLLARFFMGFWIMWNSWE